MGTIVSLNSENEKSILEKTIEILKKSGVAIVPTDTVYGIVCDGENDCAKNNIYKIKNRPDSKPLIGFVKSIGQAESLAFIPEKFLPFISNRWPGRHTFIFKTKISSSYVVSEEKTIALRIPDFRFINLLCESFLFLASTSANISSKGSVSSVRKLPEEITNLVSIIIDGGEICGKESAIWDMTQNIPKLLRGRILFVCSGNSCRSPMAQAILQNILKIPINVISAGIETNFSGCMSQQAIEVLEETGIKVENFVPRSLTKEIVDFSDLVFVMEEKHKERVLKYSPKAYDKTFVLNIPDPAGMDIFQYRRTRDIIKQRISEIVLTRIKI